MKQTVVSFSWHHEVKQIFKSLSERSLRPELSLQVVSGARETKAYATDIPPDVALPFVRLLVLAGDANSAPNFWPEGFVILLLAEVFGSIYLIDHRVYSR